MQRFIGNRLHVRESRRKRSKGQPRHRLTQIDPGRRTAVCAICGPTTVHEFMAKGMKCYRCASRVCMPYPREAGVHLVNPYARIHILSQIDEENNTAICIKCGPVKVDWNASPSLKALATDHEQVQENTRLVTGYKRRHACKRCGSMAVLQPDGFAFFEMHLPKQKRIAVLLERANAEELLAELDRRDLYCKKCLRLVHNSFASNTPVPEFRPFPTLF